MIARRDALVVALMLVLAGCMTPAPTPRVPADSAPVTTPLTLAQLAALPDPVVKREPKSRGGNRPVYTVLGKSYKVLEDASGFRQRGVASWYGTKFHGRPTANGERFDIYQLTAAHPHLPIPTYVRVTNLDNGRKTVVRINDRGPFHEGRIIDLSYAAAVKLGFHDKGTAPVYLEVLEPEPEPPLRSYLLQAGAFSSFESADRTQVALAELTGLPASIVRMNGDGLYRVRLGPLPAGEQLERVAALLEATDYGKPKRVPLYRSDGVCAPRALTC